MDNLGFFFGAYLGNFFGVHFGTRSAKEGARWAQESHQEFKEPKSCIFKNLKKPQVFYCFWIQRPPKRTSRGPRRLPRDTQRDTQRCPKLGQKVAKKWTQKRAKKTISKRKKSRSDRLELGTFLRPWGSQKRLISKMSKNCSRCLKTIPKWFKHGSRLPKLFKIAPKIRPYKDS